MKVRDHVPEIIRGLRKHVGESTPVVSHTTPFQVLVATILSARTKDENTRKASTQLFAKYPTPEKLAKAPLRSIESLIKPAGFYRTKARNIKACAEKITGEYGGEPPHTLDELVTLPGVGRKTANCVLVYAYNKPALPVDVHVHRISNRIGLVETKTPGETEQHLTKVIPKRYWIEVNHLLVKHGQRTCLPQRPRCGGCMIRRWCLQRF